MTVAASQTAPSTDGTDAALLRACAAGRSQAAFGQLVSRHAPWLYAAALRQLRDRQLAEDAVQAVFLLLWQRAQTLGHVLSGASPLQSWLFTTMRYVCLNLIRSRRRRGTQEELAGRQRALEPAAPPAAPDAIDLPPLATQLDAAVAALGAADREVVLLRFYQEMSFSQIAQQLQSNEPAIRKRLSRAIGKLRDRLHIAASPAETIATAALAGRALLPVDLVQRAMPSASSATTPSVHLAAKGALHLMRIAQFKTAAAVAAIGLSAVGVAALSIAHAQSSPATAPIAQAAAAPPAPAVSDVAQLYQLGDREVLKHIAPPFPPGRQAFYTKFNRPHVVVRVPSAFIMWWDADQPVFSYTREGGSYTVSDVLKATTEKYYQPQLEGDSTLLALPLPGDFVMARNAPDASYFDALSDIIHAVSPDDTVSITTRQVDRPVIVFTGHWKYTPAAGAASPGPELQIYTQNLDHQSSGGDGPASYLFGKLSEYIGEQVVLEADGVPQELTFNIYGQKAGRDRDLALQHIHEQTGLNWTEQTQNVRRIFVEREGL